MRGHLASSCFSIVLLLACSGRPLPSAAKEMMDAPLLQAPSNGSVTGTLWFAPNLQPQFTWSAAAGASEHEIQIGRTCEPAGAGCDLRDAEIDAMVSGTTFAPGQPMAVSMVPPVGARYYWRVRGCAASGCGPWSRIWHVDVGREKGDFDGDGFADAVSSSLDPAYAVIYWGDAAAPLSRASTIDVFRDVPSNGFDAVRVLWAGDVDGDGYQDLAIVQPGVPAPSPQTIPGKLRVFLGGPRDSVGASRIERSGGVGFGTTFAAGDFDGDGFSDVVVCGLSIDSFSPPPPTLFFGPDLTRQVVFDGVGNTQNGSICGAGGDFDNDGYWDVVLLGSNQATPYVAGVFFGGEQTAPSQTAQSQSTVELGASVSTRINLGATGDAIAFTTSITDSPLELVVRPERGRQYKGTAGAEMVLRPSPSVLAAANNPGGNFGQALAGWRADRSRGELLVVGFPGANSVLVYDGASGSLELVSWLMGRTINGRSNMAGAAVASPGDVNGDGQNDLVVGAPVFGGGPGELYLLLGGQNKPQDWDAVLPMPNLNVGWLGTFVD